jgi:hypothetical protein
MSGLAALMNRKSGGYVCCVMSETLTDMLTIPQYDGQHRRFFRTLAPSVTSGTCPTQIQDASHW